METYWGTYRAWPQIDAVLCVPILEPAAALFLPHGSLVVFIEVSIDRVQSVLLYGHRLDALGLHLLHALNAVFNRSFDRR